MSRWLRVLLSQLHSDAVIDKLAQTKPIKKSAEAAHAFVQAAKEQTNQLASGQCPAPIQLHAVAAALSRPHPSSSFPPSLRPPHPLYPTPWLLHALCRVPCPQHAEQRRERQVEVRCLSPSPRAGRPSDRRPSH